MKKTIFMLWALAATAMTFTACSNDNDPYFTASENDAPRILNTDIPEWSNGKPGTIATIDRKTNFKYDIIVTPADYTTISWYLDDVKIAEGATINQPLLAGKYTLKIVATTTKGLETSRTCTLIVRPCDGDPVASTDKIMERLVSCGTMAVLSGENMDKVSKVVIDNEEADATYNSADNNISYTVPASLTDGKHTLTLKDAEGTVYGAGYITTSSAPTIVGNGFSGKGNGTTTITGLNMDKIATITINGISCDITDKQSTSITIKIPELEAGNYDMTAVGEDGKAVNFLSGSDFVETATFTITSEVTLWTGSFDVTWGTPFDALKDELINHVSVGTILRIYVNGNGQGTAASAWWNNILTGLGDPNRGDIMISGEQVLEFQLNETSITLLNEQNGFLAVGDGYTVTKVTVE